MLTLGRVLANSSLTRAGGVHLKAQSLELPRFHSPWLPELQWQQYVQSVLSLISRSSLSNQSRQIASRASPSAPTGSTSNYRPLTRTFRASNSCTSSISRALTRSMPAQTSPRRHATNWSFQNSYRSWNSPDGLLHFSWSKPLAALIAINVGVYLTWITVGSVQKGRRWMTENFMVSTSTWKTHPWTLITSAFSHSSLLHLGFNMLAIGTIGRDLQTVMGPKAFLAFFGLSAVGSSLAHIWHSSARMPPNWQPRSTMVPMYILADGTPLTEAQAEAYAKTHGALPQSRLHYAFLNDEHVWAPALGASGIACGLFTISATLWPKRNFWVLFFKVPASRLFLLFTAFSVGNLLINPNSHIAHAAHLGGAAIGLAAAVLLRGRALRIR